MANFYPKSTAGLIAAIQAANISTGPHTIFLQAGFIYEITAPNTAVNALQTALGKSGLPVITSQITILGNGATIKRTASNTASGNFRLFSVNTNGNLTIRNTILRDGRLAEEQVSPGLGIAGAGIATLGTLTLDGCVLVNHINSFDSGYGGAIYCHEATSALIIRNSQIIKNQAPNGGGIYCTGALEISNSRIAENTGASAGGIMGSRSGSGFSTITTTAIVRNVASDGGAIRWGEGNLRVTSCDIFDNRAGFSGSCYSPLFTPIQQIVFTNNRIVGNKSADVSSVNRDLVGVSASVKVNAQSNWWGSSSGPSGEKLVGIPPNVTVEPLTGLGDSVNQFVDASSHLTSEDCLHEAICDCPFNYAADDCHSSGNPISLRLGEKRLEETDISLNSPAAQLAFTRSYRQGKQSGSGAFTYMGLGWTHNHYFTIEGPDVNDKIRLQGGQGGITLFDNVSPNNYRASSGSASTLVVNSGSTSATYIVTAADQSVYTFDNNRRLQSRKWANNETWSYAYFTAADGADLVGRLKEVSDGYGRKLQFSYFRDSDPDTFRRRKLWRVGDQTAANLFTTTGSPTGRYVEFTYVREQNNGIPIGSQVLLSGVRDVRGNQWSLVYYGSQVGETDPSLLNAFVRRLTPSLGSSGPIVKESLTYGTHQVELIVNGDMEADSDWINVGEPIANGSSTNPVYSGTKSRRVVGSASLPNTGIESTIFRLTKGRSYNFVAQVNSATLAGQVVMRAVTGEGNSPVIAFSKSASFTGSWQTLQELNYIPTETVDCKLQFIVPLANSTDFYVDAVSVLETNPKITQERGIAAGGNALLKTTYQFASSLNTTTESLEVSPTTAFTTKHYFERGIYAGSQDPTQAKTSKAVDNQFRINQQFDANGNPTWLNWSDDGKLLNGISDALNRETRFTYNGAGALVDTLRDSTDAENTRTNYLYEASQRQPAIMLVSKDTASLTEIDVKGTMENTADWPAVAGATRTLSATPRVAGNNSIRVQTTAAGQGIQSATSFNLVTDQTYVVIARVYPVSGQVRMLVNLPISGFERLTSTASADMQTWQTLRVVHKASSNSARQLQFLSVGAADFYVDAVHVIPITTLMRWQDFLYDDRLRTIDEASVDTQTALPIQRTRRSYHTSGDGNGLLASLTQIDQANPTNNKTTQYTYDSAGRVIKTHDLSMLGACQASFTAYDEAGNTRVSFCTPRASTAPVAAGGDPEAYYFGQYVNGEDKLTIHQYDSLGRRISVKELSQKNTTIQNSVWIETLTFYDALDRVVRTISNYANQSGGAAEDPTLWVWDVTDGRWEKPGGSPISHGADNTQNAIADTAFNARGMVRLTRDTLGNVTLFGYNDAGRLIKTIQSASQPTHNNDYITRPDLSGSPNPTLGAYVANTAPDLDLVTTQEYDPAGNLVKSVDTIGNVTFTVYDALNRPVKTVANAKDAATITLNPGDAGYSEANNPRSANYVPDTAADRDHIQSTEYDLMGRVLRQIDVNGRSSYAVYDNQGRVTRTISNYVPQLLPDQTVIDPATWSWNDTTKLWQRSSADTTPIDLGIGNDQNLITLTVYDSAGRVDYTQDMLGRRTKPVYDGLNRQVKSVGNYQSASGNPALWIWSTTNNRWENGSGAAISFGPNFDQNQISETVYDGNGRVLSTRDTRGLVNFNAYDTLGRLSRQISNYVAQGTSQPINWVWSTTNNRWENGAGLAISFGTDNDQNRISLTEFDTQGRVARTRDAAGIETRYEYDILGRRTRTITNYVDGVFNPALPDEDLISTTVYDRAGRVITTSDPRGTQTSFTYDRLGRRLTTTQAANTPLATTSYTCYDKARRVLRTIANWSNAPGQPSPDARDVNGNWLFNPITTAPDRDLISEQQYDRAGRRTISRDTVGNSMTTTYGKDGQVISMTDPEGVVTRYVYDRLRRRTRVIQGFVAQAETPDKWLWDAVDNRWEQGDQAGTAVAHGTNNDQNIIVDVSYDRAGRILSQREPRGNLTAYEYDQLDRRTKLTNPLNTQWSTLYRDIGSSGRTSQEMTYPGLGTGTYIVTREFDRLGRLQSIAYGDPANTRDVRFTYDALGNRQKISEFSAANFTTRVRETTFGYDDLRRLTSVGFDNEGNGTVDETVSYQYDAAGLRTRLTLPGNLNIHYTYDAKGQLISLTDWDNQATDFGYDRVGRHIATQRSNGLNSQYDYDRAGRLTSLRHQQRNKVLARFEYQVDKRGNRTGALEQQARQFTVTSTIDQANAAVTYTGTWSIVAPFRETTQITARLSATVTGREFRLTVGTGPAYGLFDVYIDGSLWESFDGYAAAAGERSIPITLDRGGTHTIALRNRAERARLSTGNTLRFKQIDLLDTVYDTQTLRYTYDALARLREARYFTGVDTAATPSRLYSYAFDRSGNRTQQSLSLNGAAPTVTNYTYNAANQLTGDGTTTYSYDPNGNLTTGATWDRANRMRTFAGADYAYDGEGRRVSQTVSSITTRYLLDIQPGLAVVLSEIAGANVTRHVHGPRGIHAQKDSANNWEWMAQDGLGSVRNMVDASANLLWSTSYDPFGTGFGVLGTPQSPYAFTGEPTLPGGLLHLRARNYHPALGVFPSLDPVEGMMDRAMSLNGYSWVEGNVVNNGDASGLTGNRLCVPFSDLPNNNPNQFGETRRRSCENVRTLLAYGITPDFLTLESCYYCAMSPGFQNSPSSASRDEILRRYELGLIEAAQDGFINFGDVRQRLTHFSYSLPADPPSFNPSLSAVIGSLIGGYMEGVSVGATVGSVTRLAGVETVYNLSTFERLSFSYGGMGVGAVTASANAAAYVGHVEGFRRQRPEEYLPFTAFMEQYRGLSDYTQAGAGPSWGILSVGLGIIHFRTPPNIGATNPIYGNQIYLSAGLSWKGIDLGTGTTEYERRYGAEKSYIDSSTCKVNVDALMLDILTGDGSPLGTRLPIGGLDPASLSLSTARIAASWAARFKAEEYNTLQLYNPLNPGSCSC